jgi:SEC-C motif-containing protein
MKKFDKCPCGSGAGYNACCGAIISGSRTAQTPEKLMRSRYTAYVAKNVDYLIRTTHPSARTDDLASSIRKWMRQVEWLKLHVVATDETHVEFIAEYLSATAPGRHHECSVFEKIAGEWFYLGEETDEES